MGRTRARRTEYYKQYNRNRGSLPKEVIGIDGEGISDDDGTHRYTYVCASNSEGKYSDARNWKDRLTTLEILEWLINLPSDKLYIGFSINYDFTKWFEDIDNRGLYCLPRPETRRRGRRIVPLHVAGYRINYVRGRLTVGHGKKSVTVWDVWAFFQGTFIDACKNWEVINAEEANFLKRMKDSRGAFNDEQTEEIERYCQLECAKLAELGTRLRQAHVDAGLPLTTYYGAGSTASALLSRMGVKEYMPRSAPPGSLPDAVRCILPFAFFGGRFEISRIGSICKPVHSYDIASAYPYQLYALPCLACGTWEHVTDRRRLHTTLLSAQCALVRYELPECDALKVRAGTSPQQWGPFPLRTLGLKSEGIDNGCIIYPSTSGGGWTTQAEYLAAIEHWPNVVALEAWVYRCECKHHPFQGIGEAYCERLRWGKDGKGIVMKLGPNSCYGKLAQAVGIDPPYQCFLWALLVTGGCRAQLMRMIAQQSVVLTATDGIVSEHELSTPPPSDTGTATLAHEKGKHPLGAWEPNILESGVHLIRPGIAFPLGTRPPEINADDWSKSHKGRGIGKTTLEKAKQAVLEGWERDGPVGFRLANTMFNGWKSATSRVWDVAAGEWLFKRHPNYGRWTERETTVSYLPEPKRPHVYNEDKTLHTWAFGSDIVSAPYLRILTADAARLKAREVIESEQPDRQEIGDHEF